MAAESGRNSSGLIEDLVKNGPSYNIWQAIWLSENLTGKLNPDRKEFLLDQKGLNFRPDDKYEYPPKDIRSISFDNDIITFVLTFMGLYGINSPLPRCYHEPVSMQQRLLGSGEVPLQNFFDIFNNRFYWLYYNSWKKFRYYLYLNSGRPNNKITERISSFTGRELFKRTGESNLNDFLLLKFSGIFSLRTRNKAGLLILLKFIFPNYKIKIREFVPRWIELSGAPSLGDDNFSLGKNSFAGKYILDRMSRICIEIGVVTFEEYLGFLPGTKNSDKLKELLKLYLNDGLEFDFLFKINSNTILDVSWNDQRLKLGSTLWMGKPKESEEKVYLSYEEITGIRPS
ncbi:MAG: type VI secretion system baseplate subunit TssG [Ignavibacteriaceae bacterium]|jgi:type VI secretion system protein ImpH|nr:type VI secretion system baseplate subunit TssG [Ignavibacteriaceae bacterium]